MNVGYNQAELLEGGRKQLLCSGQTAVDEQGQPQHPDDMRQQIQLALSNLEAVLGEADMSFADVVRLNVYTTDVDEALTHFDVLGATLGPHNVMPPMSLLGVTRLAIPGLLIEFEATAMQ